MATPQQLQEAIRRADAAGDAASVRALGAELRRQQQTTMPQKPTSFWQGVAEEVGKAGNNAGRIIGQVNPFLAGIQALSDLTGLGKKYTPKAQYQANRQAIAQAAAASPYRGSTAGRVVGGIVGTLPLLAAPGGAVAQGVMSGGLLTDNMDDKAGLVRDLVLGGVGGKAGDVIGKRVIAPVAERVGRTKIVRKPVELAASALRKMGAPVSTLPLPKFTAADRAVQKAGPLDDVTRNLTDAQRLNLPYALADASPELRTLAGSVARKSTDARALAERTFAPRARGQASRAVEAIDAHLAPVTNIAERSGQIRQAARAKAQPFYDAAYGRPAPMDADLTAMLQTPAGKAALADAYTIAQNRGLNPTELGFVIDDSGTVGLQSEAGRYVAAEMPRPQEAFGMTSRRGVNGQSWNQRGPVDLVGWLRANGGLRDQGGELGHMGIGNATRAGMDHTGLETRIGPLVHDNGMTLDDAAHAAWEAGYFPELTDRPSVNQFLDAVRGTHEGWNRRFHPDDWAALQAHASAAEDRNLIGGIRAAGEKPVFDTSVAAGQHDYLSPPPEAYGEKPVQLPTMQTLDLVKQALDGKLNGMRNPLTGRLDLEGNQVGASVNDLLQRFKVKMDDMSPDYWAARSAYQEGISPRSALQTGFLQLPKTNVPMRDFEAGLAAINPKNIPEAQRGFATAMSDQVDKVRLSGNPYEAIYGSPLQQQKVGALFPQGAEDFGRVYGLEQDMGKTLGETLGGSPTQARAMADQQFDALGPAVDMAGNLATGGKLGLARAALRAVADAKRVGMGKAKADAMAPALFNTDTSVALDYLQQLAAKQAEQRMRQEAYRRAGGLLSFPLAVGTVVGAQSGF